MSKISGANLFKESAQWPLIPPWWVLSSPQAAALLNVTSATLLNWRVRGEGPSAVPPMYLKPTQGDPIYYIYGEVRSWAAEKLGLTYSMDDQCRDFFDAVCPPLNQGEATWKGRAWGFDSIFKADHAEVRKGQDPIRFPLELIQDMDLYYSRQPKQLKPIRELCS
jgi:hypothetical protein